MFDITGQWVAVVNEDWRWRMVTPPKGDTSSVPLNPAGRRVASWWDLAADRAQGRLCKAFGGPGLIRQPGRIRIRWKTTTRWSWSSMPACKRAGCISALLLPRSPGRFRVTRLMDQATAEPRDFGRGGGQQRGSLGVYQQFGSGLPAAQRGTLQRAHRGEGVFDTFTLPEDGSWLIVTTVIEDPSPSRRKLF